MYQLCIIGMTCALSLYAHEGARLSADFNVLPKEIQHLIIGAHNESLPDTVATFKKMAQVDKGWRSYINSPEGLRSIMRSLLSTPSVKDFFSTMEKLCVPAPVSPVKNGYRFGVARTIAFNNRMQEMIILSLFDIPVANQLLKNDYARDILAFDDLWVCLTRMLLSVQNEIDDASAKQELLLRMLLDTMIAAQKIYGPTWYEKIKVHTLLDMIHQFNLPATHRAYPKIFNIFEKKFTGFITHMKKNNNYRVLPIRREQ